MGKESKESKLGIIVMHKVFENPGGWGRGEEASCHNLGGMKKDSKINP